MDGPTIEPMRPIPDAGPSAVLRTDAGQQCVTDAWTSTIAEKTNAPVKKTTVLSSRSLPS